MNADLLREIGETLYGPRWQTDLARDLAVTGRTMRRWARGDFDMPAGLERELHSILTERETALATVRRKLPR